MQKVFLQVLSIAEKEKLFSDKSILVYYKQQPKVLYTPESIFKVFYPRNKLISSDKFQPKALKFVKNAQKLAEKNFTSVEIEKIFKVKSEKTYIIQYKNLKGQDFRTYLMHDLTALNKLAHFVADLHKAGIFFRGIHLGNLLYHEGQFSLIDIADLHFKKRALPLRIRFRNLRHLLFYRDDRDLIQSFGLDNFLQAYQAHAKLTGRAYQKLQKKLVKYERKKTTASA